MQLILLIAREFGFMKTVHSQRPLPIYLAVLLVEIPCAEDDKEAPIIKTITDVRRKVVEIKRFFIRASQVLIRVVN